MNADLTKLPAGTVVNGKHGRWTFLGTPYASHPSTLDGSQVWRVLTFSPRDVYAPSIGHTFEVGDVPEAGGAL